MEQVARFRFSALAGAALLLAGSTIPARAQADPDDAKRGVARISVMDGDVTVRRGDSGDWVAGVINAPLLTGDQIATAPNSRAEVQFDAANAVRMGGDASLRIAQLEYDRYQFQLARGTVTYRVLRPTEVNIEVDTQNLAIRPSKQGVYRIRVDDAGLSEVTVRLGSVEVSTTAGSQWVNAGQTLLARGPAADPEFKIAAAIPIDDWDHWNESRDAAELTSASNQYVPDGVYGAEDLDRYGTWSNVPDYGYVWQPAEPVGWSPYSLGQWTWEDWYGWTWVSCDPWGWAPYHYGRWFFRPQIGWAWYPGARFTRHYWSPGLVAFMGWGGAGFGLGYVGWVPLAPYEVFRPWWGRSYYGRPGYMNRNIGISSVNISNIYRNAAIAGGVVGVHGTDFQNGRFQTISHFSGAQIRDARVAQGAMPLAPGAANLRFSAKAIATTPRANANQQFFSREQPSPAARIPFAQQQRAFQAARAGNSSPVAQSGARQATPGQPGAWNRFGDRTAQETQPQSNRNVPQAQNPAARENDAPAQQDRAGWQRFGAPGAQTEGGGRPATPPAAQSGANGWNRFGSPGSAVPNAPRPQNPAPAYRAPQYSAPSRPSAPQSSPSRPSGGGGGGGGGMSHSGGSGGASGGGGHSSGGGGGGHSGGGGGGGHR